VRSILEQVGRTIIVNVPFDPATSRRVFTMAASDYAVTVLLTDALHRISKAAPGVTVVIIPLRERTPESDDLGLDLVILPKAYAPASLPHEVLFEDAFTAIVWRGHPSVSDTLDPESVPSPPACRGQLFRRHPHQLHTRSASFRCRCRGWRRP